MPIKSQLEYRPPTWMKYAAFATVAAAMVVFWFAQTLTGVVCAVSVFQAYDSLRYRVECRFWKRQVEQEIGLQVAQALGNANRDLLRVVK